MTTLPATGSISAVTDQAEAKAYFEQIRDFINETFGAAPFETLVLADGVITPTVSQVYVDTEAAAPTDELTDINNTNMPLGRIIILRAADPARITTAQSSAGSIGTQLSLATSTFAFDHIDKWLMLTYEGASWREVARFYGSDGSGHLAYLGLVPMATGTGDLMRQTSDGSDLQKTQWKFSTPVTFDTDRLLDLTDAGNHLIHTSATPHTLTCNFLAEGNIFTISNAGDGILTVLADFGFFTSKLLSKYDSITVTSRGTVNPDPPYQMLAETGGSGQTGMMFPFAGGAEPAGYLLCAGQEVSRTTYANLFAVIGSAWGSADPANFRIPDMRGSSFVGLDNMGGTAAGRITSASVGGSSATSVGGGGGTEVLTSAVDEVAQGTGLGYSISNTMPWRSGLWLIKT